MCAHTQVNSCTPTHAERPPMQVKDQPTNQSRMAPHLDLTQSDASVGVLVQHPQDQPLKVRRYPGAERRSTDN